MKNKWKINQRIHVSGTLPWGSWKGSRAATDATILEVRRCGLFVILDMIDGDPSVWTLVPKKLCRILNEKEIG